MFPRRETNLTALAELLSSVTVAGVRRAPLPVRRPGLRR